MLKSRLFLKVCAVMIGGLTLFALMLSLFWYKFFDMRFNSTVSELTTAVSLMLLPDATAGPEAHLDAINQISESLPIQVTLYAPDGEFIGASGQQADYTDPTGDNGSWEQISETALWATRLPDGRVVIADLTYFGVPDDAVAVSISFVLFAIVISSLMYPVIRRITWRLERLQKEVEAVDVDNLKARVTVDGQDEIAKLAASFNSATATIEDLVNRQRILLANASHELRTPLARIRMGIELLSTKDTPQRRAELKQDIGELNTLIDDLITMARFDTEGYSGAAEPVDLMSIASEEAARTTDCSVTGGNGEVLGDRRMLQHLIRNLLDNAQKYGRPPIEIRIKQDRNSLILSVIDHGEGIPESERDKVFEPFFRGAGKQNATGSGLGLSLVYRIAKAHDASVKIETSPNSAVSVVFPALDPN